MAVDKRWRKVTKKHPGKKWEGERVLAVHRDCDSPTKGATVRVSLLPDRTHWNQWEYLTQCGYEPVTHWMPWPEPPEMPKRKGD